MPRKQRKTQLPTIPAGPMVVVPLAMAEFDARWEQVQTQGPPDVAARERVRLARHYLPPAALVAWCAFDALSAEDKQRFTVVHRLCYLVPNGVEKKLAERVNTIHDAALADGYALGRSGQREKSKLLAEKVLEAKKRNPRLSLEGAARKYKVSRYTVRSTVATYCNNQRIANPFTSKPRSVPN
jgi:hypothetical protein